MAVKLPKIPKLSIKRVDMERMLIVCAAVMVVVLALRGGEEAQTEMVYQETPLVSAETSAQTAADVEMQSVICWYEDGDGC